MTKKSISLTVFFLLLVLGSFSYLAVGFLKVDHKLVTPILTSARTLGANLWFPQDVLGIDTAAPEITAKSAFFIDTNNGKVLFSKNPQQKLPIASLAKVMTVLIALDNRGLEEKFLVSDSVVAMEPDKMLLLPGEKLTLQELLYGIFLISANDGAEVLAESIGGREEFISKMNIKAAQLGMVNSHFVNPTGLDEDTGNSYSTAYDLAILTRHIIRYYPQVIDISKTDHIILPKTLEHQDYDMYSGINLLTTYPGVIGFKTGYTPEAGLTIVTLARREGHEVIGILLGSDNRREETKMLLDYSFDKLGVAVK